MRNFTNVDPHHLRPRETGPLAGVPLDLGNPRDAKVVDTRLYFARRKARKAAASTAQATPMASPGTQVTREGIKAEGVAVNAAIEGLKAFPGCAKEVRALEQRREALRQAWHACPF